MTDGYGFVFIYGKKFVVIVTDYIDEIDISLTVGHRQFIRAVNYSLGDTSALIIVYHSSSSLSIVEK